jgi:pyruvate formate lyase activating enzyme
MSGRIHSLETLGANDGPGLRTVIFLQGCPLRCRYCHNPDSWPDDGGQQATVGELVSKAQRLKPYFSDQGGVTLSGGEPLHQPEFTATLLAALKEAGIHTALDTSGWLPDADLADSPALSFLPEILRNTDLILLDIKSPDPAMFRWLTGRPINNLHSFLDVCEQSARPVWIRQVIVPGWNDQISDLLALADFIERWPRLPVSRVQLLPYHTWGADKWFKLNYPYPLEGTPSMDKDNLISLQRLIEQRLAHRLPGLA